MLIRLVPDGPPPCSGQGGRQIPDAGGRGVDIPHRGSAGARCRLHGRGWQPWWQPHLPPPRTSSSHSQLRNGDEEERSAYMHSGECGDVPSPLVLVAVQVYYRDAS